MCDGVKGIFLFVDTLCVLTRLRKRKNVTSDQIPMEFPSPAPQSKPASESGMKVRFFEGEDANQMYIPHLSALGARTQTLAVTHHHHHHQQQR